MERSPLDPRTRSPDPHQKNDSTLNSDVGSALSFEVFEIEARPTPCRLTILLRSFHRARAKYYIVPDVNKGVVSRIECVVRTTTI